MADDDDLIEIEWLEPDDGAFGTGSAATRTPPVRATRARSERSEGRRRWVAPAAVAAVVAIAVTAVAWRPWQQDSAWRTLPVAVRVAPEFDEQLIIPSLSDDFFQLSGGEWGEAPITNSIGYVFAEPGGTWEASRWAKFYAAPSGGFAPLGDTNSPVVIRGTPARLVDNTFGRITIAWGPVDNQRWGVDTNGLTRTEAIAFAQAVAIVDGRPVVSADYDLGDLQPIGDLDTFDRARGMLTALQGNASSVMHTPTALSFRSADGVDVGLTSIAASPESLAMAAFVLGGGAPLTIHGLPARVAHRDDLGTVVMWSEGNRLIAVSATTRTDATVALAQSVRPATGVEWADLTAHTTVHVDDLPLTGAGLVVGSGTSPNGREWLVRVWNGDDSSMVCLMVGTDAERTCSFVTGAFPDDMPIATLDSTEVHVYFHTGPEAGVVTVTGDAGTPPGTTPGTTPFVALSKELSAAAVLVPTGATVIVSFSDATTTATTAVTIP